MRNKELLAPAGDLDSLYQAVNNGADAVYIGGKNFGARHFAKNFTNEEIDAALKYCHLFGVKLYVTVNTLIFDGEIDSFLEYVRFLHKIGVDAVIMQDIGMITLVRKKFPNLVIHASTQAHNNNIEKLKLLEELGVKRVVFARELSIDKIGAFKTNLEKEVFIHGAICISYSGLCLFSSVILNRSGNRGECAGFCRLPYELYENDKKIDCDGDYLLSPKELSSINDIKNILDSDVYSLKIEGRMKSPYYVGFITRLYRNILDNYYAGKSLVVSDEDIKSLKNLFNREFTKGFINNEVNNNLMNRKTPNHIGTVVGEVVKCNVKKVYIKLTDNLNQEDGIRFSNGKGMIVNFLYNEKGLLINSGKKGDIVILDNRFGKLSGEVRKTTDSKLVKSLSVLPSRKIGVDISVKAKLNQNLIIEFKCFNYSASYKGEEVSRAVNKAVTKEDIINKLSKLGNTCFSVNSFNIDIDDNVFIPVSYLNNIRRELVDKLMFELEKNNSKFEEKDYKFSSCNMKKTNRVSFLVRNEDQLNALIDKDVDIYLEDYKLYLKYKKDSIYYRTPRVEDSVMKFNGENIVSSSLESIYCNKNSNVISDIYLNITNRESLRYLANLGVERIGLSVEIPDLEKLVDSYNSFYNTSLNLEILVYGRIELMAMKYCILNDLVNKNKVCSVCKNANTYYIKDRNDKNYPFNHIGCNSYLLNYENIDNISKIPEYKNLGITNYRVDLFDETYDEVIKIYEKTLKML